MAIPLTDSESGFLQKVLAYTRLAVTQGTNGSANVPPVMVEWPAGADGGTFLFAIGMVKTLEDGLILRANDQRLWRVNVSDAGVLVTTEVTT